MRVTTADGAELDAEYSFEPDGAGLALVVESAASAEALTLLLTRLRQRGTTLRGALLDSTPLVDHDMESLGRDLSTRLARTGGARFHLEVPGYAADDAQRLAEDLAKPVVLGTAPEATALLRSALGAHLETVARRKHNRVIAVGNDTATVATDRSPDGEPVPVREVQAALDLLYTDGVVRVAVENLGHRSSFIGALLATLPGATVTRTPPAVILHEPAFPARNRKYEVLDGRAEVTVRKEQAELRRLLLGGRPSAPCDLCGDEFPADLLVAAHIKRRSVCSDDERNHLPHVAMLACRFGCDSLFESGYVTVDRTGHVRTAPCEDGLTGLIRSHLARLDGRPCRAHRTESQAYFSWHHDNVFRRT